MVVAGSRAANIPRERQEILRHVHGLAQASPPRTCKKKHKKKKKRMCRQFPGASLPSLLRMAPSSFFPEGSACPLSCSPPTRRSTHSHLGRAGAFLLPLSRLSVFFASCATISFMRTLYLLLLCLPLCVAFLFYSCAFACRGG